MKKSKIKKFIKLFENLKYLEIKNFRLKKISKFNFSKKF